MSTVAIKISAELAAATRAAAKAADRSLTGQIEHWAKIGRGAEEKLTAREIISLKAENISGPYPENAAVDPIRSAHADFLTLTPQQKREKMGLDQQVRFEPESGVKGGFIRIDPDGTRTRGKIIGRIFQPLVTEASVSMAAG